MSMTQAIAFSVGMFSAGYVAGYLFWAFKRLAEVAT